MIPELHNWFTKRSVWKAPEDNPIRVAGEVWNHPGFPNGHKIQTSSPTSFDPQSRLLTTISGSVYRLEKPDPEWIKWMREQGIEFDPENPIRFT